MVLGDNYHFLMCQELPMVKNNTTLIDTGKINFTIHKHQFIVLFKYFIEEL